MSQLVVKVDDVTMLFERAPELISEVLRGDRSRRPRRDDVSAAGLRAALEDHVFAVFAGERRDAPVVITAASLGAAGHTLALPDSPVARARGILVATAFRLLVAQVHLADPYADALTAWRAERPRHEVLDALTHLDDDQRARLRADVTAHVTTLRGAMGVFPSAWRPRTSQRARQLLGGTSVCLRDVIDLVVGSTQLAVANVALVDITTSPLGPGAERVMRYHALMQTLRTSVVPLRTSIFSSATGELWSADVDHELLMRAVEDVARVLDRWAAPSVESRVASRVPR